jgi:adenylate cyclase
MPSLLPGFEYDVFISYRHNDNRSGWVTDFVNALQEELGATIKEPLSIYFDKNPHDGLLETHSVDKSLEGKLKCIIFIPIISQTYSDPKSFAWQHEFCAFNRLSRQDELGRDLKLSNGNVTSRILPVKIHDLDPEDKMVIENEIGGALRAIEFIFTSAGVNRPLRSLEEHPQDNINHTFYRDQVNKVANAIKAILQAVKAPSNVHANKTQDVIEQSDPSKRRTPSRKLILASVVLIVLIALAFWKYNSKPVELVTNALQDKSLVVLPFEDMSPKKDQEWFSDGLTEELLNSLSALQDLRLISRTTSFSFKDKGLSAKIIADSLGVAHVLEGSVRKSEDQLRVTVQLIKAQDDTHLWSHVYEYTIDSVFKIQGDISKNVANTLNLLLDAQTREHMYNAGTTSVEAYQEYLKGKAIYHEAHIAGKLDQLNQANKYLENAISIYPNFARAYYDHADVFSHSLLAASELMSLSDLSEKEQYDRMMFDLNKALSLSQIPSERMGYSFTRDFFSKDWTRLASYLDVKENWQSGWEVFLALVDPDFAIHRYLKAIEIDPFSDMDRYWAAIAFANRGDLDSALVLYTNEYTKSTVSAWVKSVLHFRNNDYPKALESAININLGKNLDGYLFFLQLLNGRQAKNRAELDRFLATQPLLDPFGYSPILLYNALGEYDRADSIASSIDKRLLGHCGLAMDFLNYGLHFHLSATPNFAARLRELGIIPEDFEKKNYKKIPVVKVSN